MRAIGVVRKIDKLGRVVIPVELRRAFNIAIKDPVEIYTENDCIIIKKYSPECLFCGEANAVRHFSGKNICPSCMEAIADEINKH